MPKWVHFVFCAVWFGTAVVFARLAFDSYQTAQTQLVRFTPEHPTGARIEVGGIDPFDVMKSMSDSSNQNVETLEKSIRDTARLTFTLNLLSCFMAIFGLAAQCGAYLYEKRRPAGSAS